MLDVAALVDRETAGDGGAYEAARARIAAQRGRLHGWRPLPLGDVVVVAVEVLGMAAGAPATVGLRVVVAARDPALLAARGVEAAELALRKRGVLGDDDAFEVARRLQYPADRRPEKTPLPATAPGDEGGAPPVEAACAAPEEATAGAGGSGDGPSGPDDVLSWPWATLVVNVPASRLPAIAGLATDQVHGG